MKKLIQKTKIFTSRNGGSFERCRVTIWTLARCVEDLTWCSRPPIGTSRLRDHPDSLVVETRRAQRPIWIGNAIKCQLAVFLHSIDSQMTNFVSGDDDSTETAGVFNNGDAVNLLQAFIHNASTANVSESFKSKRGFRFRVRNSNKFIRILAGASPCQAAHSSMENLSNFTAHQASPP